MFLYDLSNEQKDLFVDLAIFAMKSNGTVDKREKILLERYCREMDTQYRDAEKNNDCDEVLRKLKSISNEETLRKITIEITTLLYADDNLADEEDAFLNKIKEEFQFSVHDMGEILFATKHLLLSLNLIQNVIEKV